MNNVCWHFLHDNIIFPNFSFVVKKCFCTFVIDLPNLTNLST